MGGLRLRLRGVKVHPNTNHVAREDKQQHNRLLLCCQRAKDHTVEEVGSVGKRSEAASLCQGRRQSINILYHVCIGAYRFRQTPYALNADGW